MITKIPIDELLALIDELADDGKEQCNKCSATGGMKARLDLFYWRGYVQALRQLAHAIRVGIGEEK